MASICMKCGAALSPNELTCASCGAGVASGDAVAVCIPPTAASGKSTGGTIKIVLIVIAVIVGLGILGLGAIGFIGYRIAKGVHVDPSGRVTMTTPAGTITTTPDENISEADLGVEIYPGSQPAHKGMRMEMPNGSGVQLDLLTSDSPAQVLDFYKSKLGSSAVVVSLFGVNSIHLQLSKQESVRVQITANSKLDNGKTRISIMHMKQKPS
ncbi:MAG: hypothetical protein ABSB60_17690 [Terracidiphilus sp.]